MQVVETKLAPDGQGLVAFPGGIWTTDPAAEREHDGCHSPRLEPSMGSFYLLEQQPRVWIVIRGIKEGSFAETSQPVSYEQNGQEYRQEASFYFKGSVKDGSDGPKMDRVRRAAFQRRRHSTNIGNEAEGLHSHQGLGTCARDEMARPSTTPRFDPEI